MKILAFESSCDETAVAVVEDGRTVLSDAIASQADLHALYGGVVPEIASRKHVEAIAALTDQALRQAGCEKSDIDAVAVTYATRSMGFPSRSRPKAVGSPPWACTARVMRCHSVALMRSRPPFSRYMEVT